MRLRSLLLLLCCSFILSCSTAQKVESVSASWEVLGSTEFLEAQTAFTVSREATGARRVLVSAHHLVQITRLDDGTFVRAYRDEPCVLYISQVAGTDIVLTPKDRRWKMPADHSCDVAQAALTLHVHIDDVAKTLHLTVRGPKNDPQPASFSVAYNARIERQTQLPGLD